jgi:hypothetical protein
MGMLSFCGHALSGQPTSKSLVGLVDRAQDHSIPEMKNKISYIRESSDISLRASHIEVLSQDLHGPFRMPKHK